MNDFGFGGFVTAAMIAFILAPLGIWKLIELVLWFTSHVAWVH